MCVKCRSKFKGIIKCFNRVKVAKVLFSVGTAALLTLLFKVKAGAGINVSSLSKYESLVSSVLRPIDLLVFMVIVAFVSLVSAALIMSSFERRVPAILGAFIYALISGVGIMSGSSNSMYFLILVLWGCLTYLSYIGLDILSWLYNRSSKDNKL